jgi:ubiquinone/menaquinone biosynthesis C-methylase UbiE
MRKPFMFRMLPLQWQAIKHFFKKNYRNTFSMIKLINPLNNSVLVKNGPGYTDEKGNVFPVSNGVLRLVQDNNYTDNFGFQWNKFQKTQIDRDNKNSAQSAERFFAETGWDKIDLSGLNVLEAGSGAGRFSQVFLDHTKGNLYSIDYSDAVSANYRNNGHHGERFHLFQASIYEMPFPDNSFDKVFCFGVLQHTPDFKRSVQSLIAKAKRGGEVIVDFYPVKGWWTKVHAKYIFRPFTKRMSHEKLLRKIERNAGWLTKTYFFFNKIGLGKIVNRFLPICDIKGTLPAGLSKNELREWVILDTFDMYSPAHDHPQKISTVKKWFEESGMKVTFADFIHYGKEKFSAAVVKGIKQ